jgi:hypothetical protein
MSLIAVPQLRLDLPLLPEEVLDIYLEAGQHPNVMLDNVRDERGAWLYCKMGRDEHKVINHAFRLLGHHKWQGAQVGELLPERPVYWGWVTVWEYQYVLAKWQTASGGPDGHWTVFDAEGRELYDPWDAALAGRAIEKRRIVQRLLYRCWKS